MTQRTMTERTEAERGRIQNAATGIANRNPAPAFKAEVAFAAIRALKSVEEISREFGVEAADIEAWKNRLLEDGAIVFAGDAAVPRVLSDNPYGPEKDSLPLGRRVQMAAEASCAVGRSIGAIVMRIGAREAHVDRADQSLVEDLAAHLKGKLNASDYAAPAGRDEIIVYVSLIETREDLQAVARRLHHHATHWLDAGGHPEYALSAPGAAFYPDDGDCAGRLHDAASAQARLAQTQVITLRRKA